MQRTPKVSDDDVRRVVQREFGADGRAALAVLNAYRSEGSGSARVHLAALKLANGSLTKLAEEIDRANQDFRDVLADAEYPEASRDWSALDALSDKERQLVYDSDWKQYEEWLTRR